MRKFLFSAFILLSKLLPAQSVTASFNAPDTVCINSPVNIQNTSQGASTYFWNFCTANINQPPTGTNLGNIGGQFRAPVYMDYVFTNGNYYGFVTNNNPGGLVRLDFGNSLLNTPVATNLGTVGGAITDNTEGVQIANDNGSWYVLIVGGDVGNGSIPSLTTVSLGTNIANNAPTATNWGNIGNLSYPHDLYVFNDNGHWYGLTVNYSNSTVTRFDLTTSLSNTPSATNLGNIGNLSGPTGIQAINDNGNWRVFVTNATSSTLSRLDFGSSLLNVPTGVNLGNPNNAFVTSWDIYILRYCGENEAYVINANGSYDIVKLDFGNSLLNTPTAISLGNQGNLNFPHCITKLFRVGSDVYSFITNVNNNTLTLLDFQGCTNASVPNSTAQNPPPITYNTPGTYNINLTVDDGLPTQTSFCKQVVVQNCARIINDYTEVLGFNICKNEVTVADASKYNAGDTVLLIQMKGAVIDSTNTSNFGTVTDYKNAGNYEYNYVKQKTGNVIQLKNLVTRLYDIPAGKVQLIRVPYYDNLTVDNTLTCLQWDGSKGGVLAFNVKNTLTMNADIDVSGKGFLGGQVINPKNNSFYCHENNYYYPNDPIKAAPKGEGIAIISDQKTFGKGALSNGGGGGLEHNSGGGGGSNITNGGLGGKEWISCGPPINNNGIGGKPLTYSNIANKIFLGGGGGAGHCDNLPGFNPLGGNGGGMIIIKSNFIKTNNYTITANGSGGVECFRDAQAYKCHEGMGGGGGGGSILIDANNFLDNVNVHINGGKGADMNGEIQGQLGPGGGGGGGICWLSNATLPGNFTVTKNGGANGVNIDFGNDPYGSTPGEAGSDLFNLKIPIDTILFKPNIDSVRIKDSATSCSSFNFKGLGYTNKSTITSWKWTFGDGSSDVQQNTSHSYSTTGAHSVKLVVTDVNGCMDSVSITVTTNAANFDFSYEQDICNPLSVKFNNLGTGTTNPYWSFGDGNTITGTLTPTHTYLSPGNYLVKFSVQNGACTDTLVKTISLSIIPANIIITPDTTICANSTKQLRTIPSLNFCWSPVTYLDNPLSPNPVTSTPQNITYYFTAQVPGNNLIINGNFNSGNSGFTSEYIYANPNITEGQYFVGPNPQAWNSSLSPCKDHTTGNGNMMLVNGDPLPNVNVWKETVTVTPNTNYAFSTWIEALYPPNPAQLSFSINGSDIGNLITASLPTCTWTQFYTTWNSGNNTSATISIVNKNTFVQGNDFALDDISFAPVLVERDSVKITVNTPFIKSNNDSTVCAGSKIQLNTFGAVNYTWTPSTGLSNPSIGNPIATINNTTTYYVSGINSFGCIAKDTVNFIAVASPSITKSNDTSLCGSSPVQLQAGGGTSYTWTPSSGLSDPNIPNPIATPLTTTVYHVTVTNALGCSKTDSVKITVNNVPSISKSSDTTICANSSVQLTAGGGTKYSWTPATGLNNPNISNPIATPAVTTRYFVTVTNAAGCSKMDSITVTVKSAPIITKSNDTSICFSSSVQLLAGGGTSYAWTPPSSLSNPNINNPIATPLTTTLYYVTVTNATGCTKKDSIKITVNTLPIITKSKDAGICNNASIQLSAGGGISYSWTPASTLNNPNISNPIATPSSTTTYYVTVTNAAGCSKTDSIKISTSIPPVISKSNDTSICKNTTVQLFAAGGATYLWSPASTLNNAGIPDPTAFPKATTTYYITVTNSGGCSKTDSVKIVINPVATITRSNDTTICNQASVRIFASGGASYLWSPASSLDNPNSPNPVASPLTTTTYQVAIKDSYLCNYQDSVKVTVLSAPVFSVSPGESVCSGLSEQLLASGGDTYIWSPADGLNNPDISNPIATPNTSVTYTVTIHENTCNTTGTLSTEVLVLPLPSVHATSANDLTCSISSSQLNATGAINYTWSPATGLNNSNIENPVASPTSSTLYTVTGKGNNGCSNSDTVTVKVDYSINALYLLPNSFTPNGDGLNDCFGVKYWGLVQNLDFRIFNRFGNMVFHTNDPNVCWDGTYKQQLQDPDVFVYIVEAKTACGVIKRKGIVTLLK